jgi:type IV secretion system protein VirB9
MLRSATLALIACAGAAAHAQVTVPQPGPGDPRIRETMFNENAVVSIRAQLGYEMTIEFDPNERIENVSIGDSLSWQVTPNRKATMLFLKPMSKNNPTSMTVATSMRIYSFLLTAYEGKGPNDPDAMFRLRFLYPIPPAPVVEAPPPVVVPPPPPKPEDFNFQYETKGTKTLIPVRVFDDGKSTYFQFAPGKDTPAVFAIGVDGREEMANTRVASGYTIADFVAQTFILRYGKAKADVVNRGWRPPSAPVLPLPQPASSSGGR